MTQRPYIATLLRVTPIVGCVLSLFLVQAVFPALHGLPTNHRNESAVAATVDGMIVSMAEYEQQLTIEQRLYTGLRAPAGTRAAAVIAQQIADHALDQAIADLLIRREAQRRHIMATADEIDVETENLVIHNGGWSRVTGQWKLTLADMRAAAETQVLYLKISQLLNNHDWLDSLAAQASITYDVGSRAGMNETTVPAPYPGRIAPQFVAVNVRSGHTVALADLQGKPVIMILWSTLCLWCDSDLTLLNAFARQNSHDVILAVDEGDSQKAITTYRGKRWPALQIWQDQATTAQAAYGATGLPATFFIDAQGIVRAMTMGPLTEMATLTRLAQLIAH